MSVSRFSVDVSPDWEGLLRCIRREGTPGRVHHIELFLDGVVREALRDEFNLADGLDGDDPFFAQKCEIRLQRFLGYDYVRVGVDGIDFPLKKSRTEDTAELRQPQGREFVDEHRGLITCREDFEAYPWPDPEAASTRSLEWYSRNLPDDMCIIGSGGFAHFAEYLSWLMGYETLCFALFEDRDLVRAISERLTVIFESSIKRMLQFDRVKIIWGSDDMGFRTGPLISPEDLREFVLPGHRLMAKLSHDAGRPYLLHSCGDLSDIIEDLIEDVGIDAKHSFEDVIEPVTLAKERYGDRIALLGGIDMDFICRADELEIRTRVRETLEKCMPGGGYVLGTGNSVANYIPISNYLTMLDEGRKFMA